MARVSWSVWTHGALRLRGSCAIHNQSSVTALMAFGETRALRVSVGAPRATPQLGKPLNFFSDDRVRDLFADPSAFMTKISDSHCLNDRNQRQPERDEYGAAPNADGNAVSSQKLARLVDVARGPSCHRHAREVAPNVGLELLHAG